MFILFTNITAQLAFGAPHLLGRHARCFRYSYDDRFVVCTGLWHSTLAQMQFFFSFADEQVLPGACAFYSFERKLHEHSYVHYLMAALFRS
jgi:hypothetical protein